MHNQAMRTLPSRDRYTRFCFQTKSLTARATYARYSAAYTSQTSVRQYFTTTEMVADWHQLTSSLMDVGAFSVLVRQS